MGELKRNISAVQLSFYGLGNILGAGIYVLVGSALFLGFQIINLLIS